LAASKQGNHYAQVNLAVMYAGGYGVPQDYVAAHMWANIGSANGHENGMNLRDDIIAVKMTPDQIAEAQRRARVCMASSYQDCD
jgi:TPR repeat protein